MPFDRRPTAGGRMAKGWTMTDDSTIPTRPEGDNMTLDGVEERILVEEQRILLEEQRILVLKERTQELEQLLADHLQRCPGATDEARARWRSEVDQSA